MHASDGTPGGAYRARLVSPMKDSDMFHHAWVLPWIMLSVSVRIKLRLRLKR